MKKLLQITFSFILVASMLLSGSGLASAQTPPPDEPGGALEQAVGSAAKTPPPPDPDVVQQDDGNFKQGKITHKDRVAAAQRAADAGMGPAAVGAAAMSMPGMAPHYYGPYANYANSPLLSNPVLEWNKIAQQIVQPAMTGMPMGETSMAEAFVFLGYVHAAIYDALAAIEGGYTPYNPDMATIGADPNASRDAAVAAAAYGVLSNHFPSADLDMRYNNILATIVNGPMKDEGIRIGQAAAAGIITLRANDGRGAADTYTVLPPAPGVWQPTATMPDGAPMPPMDPWMAVMTPFFLSSPAQFRPGPPPALDSPEYAAQLNEVKNVGSAMSASRTPQQTEIATFWTTNMVIQYNDAFRQIAQNQQLGLLETARLMAMSHMIGSDTIMACYDSKYTYSFWRPVTAIRMADTDGNPLTDPDPAWMPALMTPNFPEYLAGHTCFASAQAEILTSFLGTNQINLDLASSATNTMHHYPSAADLRAEIVNARIWGGMHFRGSAELGVTLGQQVAQYALSNFFQPAADLSAHVQATGGIRKFVDTLPGLGASAANNLGQYIPVAVPDTTTYPGSDYYEIAVVQYEEKMHSDLPPTTLRGYVQLSTSVVPGAQFQLTYPDGSPILLPDGRPALAVDAPHYLGPTITAVKDRPVRILFRNLLPTGQDGNLFIPVDVTVMGAGMGPNMVDMGEPDPQNPMCGMLPKPAECFTENRATLHLHGGISPWISDGTPHQWVTPANQTTPYPKGVSVVPVPDMPDPGPGAMTFFYTNQQSARLMFYHDHSWGITRLNVYAGEAAPYLITDATEQSLLNRGLIPAEQIPLVVQDKTFVPSETQLAATDPLWDLNRWGTTGDLWVPHVYMPAQNPGDASGVNQFGRWAYGPWFWPPTNNIDYPPILNPYYDPACDPDVTWCEPELIPSTPYNSMGMEAFNDTPMVNGAAYPVLTVEPRSYRFRVLNAANDRFFNLSLYKAIDANGVLCDAANPAPTAEISGQTCTEVALNPAEVAAALEDQTVFPTPLTGTEGPDWIQIASEGGFLPAPAVIPAHVTTWVNDPTVFNAGNVDQHSLLLGPAERADVIVDFSAFAGQTLILYNDAPAAFPARDPRYDYYTGSADLTETGGVPSIIAGYGPNTRTVMQIRVAASAPAPAFNLAALQAAFTHQPDGSGVFESGQNPIIVGQGPYNSAYGTTFPTNGASAGLVQIYDEAFSFRTLAAGTLNFPITRKAIQDEMGEAFEKEYGRMSGNLGVETPNAQAGTQQNLILYPYVNPATEVLDGLELPGLDVTPITTNDDGTQIWKITHNGVDTHPIHWHLYDVQVINRVGWDGIIRRPDPNELGWKDTLRVSPLEDTIVALRPIVPKIPFGLLDSVRPLNPMMPLGSTEMFNNVDTSGNPIVPAITNVMTNFGWEYVWHCHILSHEEMDMMRPQTVAVSRALPTPPIPTYSRNASTGQVTLTWQDATPVDYNNPATWGSPMGEVGYRIERATIGSNGRPGAYAQVGTVLANQTSYTEIPPSPTAGYSYRVIVYNAAGSVTSAAVGAGGTLARPTSPTQAAATLLSGLQIRVTWRDNANNEDFFVLMRAVDGGAYALLTTPPARSGTGTVTYTDTTVQSGHTYRYSVAAYNNGGLSSSSTTGLVTVPGLPAAPSNLTGTATRAAKRANVTLTWTDNSNNETGFTLQRATNAAFTIGVVNTNVGANVRTASQTGLYRGIRYYFRVRANNIAGSSAWSTVFSVITP